MVKSTETWEDASIEGHLLRLLISFGSVKNMTAIVISCFWLANF